MGVGVWQKEWKKPGDNEKKVTEGAVDQEPHIQAKLLSVKNT